jgi:hypothetical protein
MVDSDRADESASSPESAAPARLRFTHFAFQRSQAGQCSAEVALMTPDGRTHRGAASGQSTPLGDFRVAGDATIKALQLAVGTGYGLELQGVKPVRAFDANVVIVSVLARGPEESVATRLVGCHLSEDGDPIRSTVIAILGATNRLLGNRIATR